MVEKWVGGQGQSYEKFLSTVGYKLYRRISSDDIYIKGSMDISTDGTTDALGGQ